MNQWQHIPESRRYPQQRTGEQDPLCLSRQAVKKCELLEPFEFIRGVISGRIIEASSSEDQL